MLHHSDRAPSPGMLRDDTYDSVKLMCEIQHSAIQQDQPLEVGTAVENVIGKSGNILITARTSSQAL